MDWTPYLIELPYANHDFVTGRSRRRDSWRSWRRGGRANWGRGDEGRTSENTLTQNRKKDLNNDYDN